MAGNDKSNNSGRGFDGMGEDEQREIASKGGKASPGKFGGPEGADPSEAGKKGAEAQPTEAKRKGGENSRRGDSDDDQES